MLYKLETKDGRPEKNCKVCSGTLALSHFLYIWRFPVWKVWWLCRSEWYRIANRGAEFIFIHHS